MGVSESRTGPSRRSAPVAVLPAPKQRRARRGEFQLGSDTPIILPPESDPFDRRLLVAAEQARDAILARCSRSLPIERRTNPPAGARAIRCVLDRTAAIATRSATARDAYRLRVRTTGIEIEAPSPDGLRHGLQTLSQLTTKRGRVAAVDILDQPDFVDRGIMLDVSRGKVPTRATLASLVDLCSRLRINVLMLYVEHTFAFREHPEIGANSSPLEAETILWLDALAADRGVELVPCLQSLGHMEHVLSLDRYAKLAESDRRWSLSPSRAETYQFLESLYDEFLPLFRSKRFNANCDEPFDLGRGQSAERAPGKSPGRLFTDHVERLERLAKRHDKQLMIWADFPLKHPDQIDRIGRDVALLDWWYEARFDFDRIRKLRRRGFEVWVCPGTSSWNCLFPRVENSARNVANWADAGRSHGATGFLNTDWGDFGHYNALGVSLKSYAWGAQQSWSGGLDPAAFDRAFSQHVFGDPSPRISRLHDRLGAVHEAGFPIANGSALQYLYFDALDRSFFLQHAKRSVLEANARKLQSIAREVDALGLEDAGEDFVGLARKEIAWASAATQLAVDKSLAALEYNAWRTRAAEAGRAAKSAPTERGRGADKGAARAPSPPLGARDRKRLARRLESLAERQQSQLDSLRRLWLARNEISEFHKTEKRLRKSISSLRAGARRLLENRPPRPPRPTEIGMLDVFNEVRRAFGMAPR